MSAIRYYEVDLPVTRRPRRRTTADSITSLLLIRLGQTAGFTLAELRMRMSDGGGPGTLSGRRSSGRNSGPMRRTLSACSEHSASSAPPWLAGARTWRPVRTCRVWGARARNAEVVQATLDLNHTSGGRIGWCRTQSRWRPDRATRRILPTPPLGAAGGGPYRLQHVGALSEFGSTVWT